MEDRIDPIHPGEILYKDFLDPMGITAYRLARDIRIDQTRVSEILRGKRGISVDTALRLGKYFGISAEFWLNIQRRYDLERKRLELQSILTAIPSAFPVVAEDSPPFRTG